MSKIWHKDVPKPCIAKKGDTWPRQRHFISEYQAQGECSTRIRWIIFYGLSTEVLFPQEDKVAVFSPYNIVIVNLVTTVQI